MSTTSLVSEPRERASCLPSREKANHQVTSDLTFNHNQATAGVRVKSKVKAGGFSLNHSQSVKGLRVKAGVKAGGGVWNYYQTLARCA